MNRRKTKAQTSILQLLKRDRRAYSHDSVVSELDRPVDRVTVYRILNRFVEEGLAHRVVADDGRQYFAACSEGCTHDGQSHGHLHFRCVACDNVECLSGTVRYPLPAGYRVENFNMIVSGTCGRCVDN